MPQNAAGLRIDPAVSSPSDPRQSPAETAAPEPVLEPPVFSPPGGNYEREVIVTLTNVEPDTAIHFTLDGSEPTTSDPIYEKPLKLKDPTVVRARAFKQGFTRSITAQQVYVPSR